MATETARHSEHRTKQSPPVSAPPEQREEIAALFKFLGNVGNKGARIPLKLQLTGLKGKSVKVPASVALLLVRMATVMARGEAVSVVPVAKELTTQQAADLLNVSRQYMVRLLDEGRIPGSRTGRHRRVRLGDVLAFKEKRDLERRAALDKLAALSQEYGGYDELK